MAKNIDMKADPDEGEKQPTTSQNQAVKLQTPFE
jgi:hypothetical protein